MVIHPQEVALVSEGAVSVRRDGTRKKPRKFAPALLGAGLFLVNNLGVIHAMIASPPGYSALGVQRHNDVAQYLTWLGGLKKQWILPNYHAAWLTPPGLLVPGLFPVALLERVFSIKPVVALQIFSLAGYIATAYALAFAYRTFFKTPKTALWAFLISLACVPVGSLPGVFKLLHGVLPVLGSSAGAGEFMMGSDGFLHGLITWPFQTYGTCSQILAMALLARYCCSHERRWFRWLAVVCFFSALIHPFEIFVTLPVALVLLLQESGPITHRLGRIFMLLAVAGAGLAPYAIQSLRVPWVHEAMSGNRPDLYIAPAYLLVSLGMPAILVLLMLLFGLPKNQERHIAVLKTWLFGTLIMFYAPEIPFSLHMLDGVLFAIGMLLAIQLEELAGKRPPLAQPALRLLIAVAAVWMLFPQVIFRARCWKDGVATPEGHIKFASAIAPTDELATLDWLGKNASPSDLVLANAETAPWIAAAPVHSFASHWLFGSSATRPRDAKLQASFFDGKLPPEKAHEFLKTLGVRFLVVPEGSAAASYLERAIVRIRFKSTTIYEIPGAHMKEYGDKEVAQLGK